MLLNNQRASISNTWEMSMQPYLIVCFYSSLVREPPFPKMIQKYDIDR